MPDKIRSFHMAILVSLGFGAAALALQLGQLADGDDHADFVIVVQLVSTATLGLLSHLAARQGWNWARWTCAILWCVGLPFMVMALAIAYRSDETADGLLAVQTLVQAWAISLLFGEDAGNWFEA